MSQALQTATLGGGCFWCIETTFNRLQGVVHAESGYSGGQQPNPTYEQVCQGTSGHVEVVRIEFDATVIRFEQLLEVFFNLHDPTTLNRQGNDVGTQYRSVIFTHDDTQRETALSVIKALEKSGRFTKPIVTAVEPLVNYYRAEPYHQGYFEKNVGQPYCAYVVAPKVAKMQKIFGDLMKKTDV